MKKLLALLLIAALSLCGAALADALPSFESAALPDPGAYSETEAKLFQLAYPYNGVDYDAYEYALPADIAVFLGNWQEALLDGGYNASLGYEQGNSAVFFSNASGEQGFLLYGYQGRMLLMVPSSYDFVPGEPVPAAQPEVEAPVETIGAEAPAAEVEEPAAVEAEPEALSSDMVEEFDPAGGEVPVEYTLEQEELVNAEAAAGSADAQVIAIVPFGDSYTYTTEVKADGTARLEADGAPYETLTFTQTMREYLRPEDFAERYASEYQLEGDEAGAGFDLVLYDYNGSAAIIPQQVMDIGFCDATGDSVDRGYQLMDAALSGNYDVAVESNVPKTLFKRYSYSDGGAEMKYLVVITYKNGQEGIILFELEPSQREEQPAEPEIVYPTLQKGDKSDDVKALQTRLVELGYLDDKADGIFGKNTEAAVKAAQAAYGLEATGIADDALQQQLFAGA